MKIKKTISALLAATLLLAFTGCNNDNYYKEVENNTDNVQLESGDIVATIEVQDFGEISIKLYPEAAPVGVQNFCDLAQSGYYEGKKFHRIMADFMIQGGSPNGDGIGGESSLEGGVGFGLETNYKMRHYYGALCYANSGAENSNTCQFYIVNNNTPLTESDFDTTVLDDSISQLNTLIDSAASAAEKDYYNRYLDMYNNMLTSIKEMPESVKATYMEKGGTLSLDGSYTVFGQTVDGYDVLEAISAVNVSESASGEMSVPQQEVIISKVTIHKVA